MQCEESFVANVVQTGPQLNVMTKNLVINFRNKEKTLANNMKRDFKRRHKIISPQQSFEIRKYPVNTLRDSLQSQQEDSMTEDQMMLAQSRPRNVFSGDETARRKVFKKKPQPVDYGFFNHSFESNGEEANASQVLYTSQGTGSQEGKSHTINNDLKSQQTSMLEEQINIQRQINNDLKQLSMNVDLRGRPGVGQEREREPADFPFQTTTSKTPVNNSSFGPRSPRNDRARISNMLSIKNVMRQSMASQQPKPRLLNNGFKIYSVPKSSLGQQP